MLYLPLPPNRANLRQHWAVANLQKQQYQARLIVALQNSQGRPSKPLDRFTAHVSVYAKKARDLDNAWASLKPMWDILTRKGWIVDDSPDHFLSGTVTSGVNYKWPHIEVQLTEVD